MRILYLGMAHDIFTPLRLGNDLHRLFVIDLFDEAFGGETIEEQRQVIVDMLVAGNNGPSLDEDDECPSSIKEPCTIISQTTVGNRWDLKFSYMGKVVWLTVFTQSFMEEWPEEINDVNVVLGIGACSWDRFIFPGSETINRMIKERCHYPFIFGANEVAAPHLPKMLFYESTYDGDKSLHCTVVKKYEKWLSKIGNWPLIHEAAEFVLNRKVNMKTELDLSILAYQFYYRIKRLQRVNEFPECSEFVPYYKKNAEESFAALTNHMNIWKK
jgi:hypothetical protein